jgi:hypothetical protein
MKMTNILGAACIVLLTLGFSQSATAQTDETGTSSATATATAKILSDLTIVKNQDIAFGNLSATTAGAVILSPILSENTNISPRTSANLGKFTIAGEGNNNVIIKWDPTVTLTNGTPAEDITMTSIVVKTDTDVAPTNEAKLATSAGQVLTLVGGKLFLWVGGNLGTLASQATGDYLGTFKVQVDYN